MVPFILHFLEISSQEILAQKSGQPESKATNLMGTNFSWHQNTLNKHDISARCDTMWKIGFLLV